MHKKNIINKTYMAYQVEIHLNMKCFNFKSSYKKNLTFNKLKFHGPYKANRKKIYRGKSPS